MTQADRELFKEILQALVDAEWDLYSREDAIIVLTQPQFDLLYSCLLGKVHEPVIVPVPEIKFNLGGELTSQIFRHADTIQKMNDPTCGIGEDCPNCGSFLCLLGCIWTADKSKEALAPEQMDMIGLQGASLTGLIRTQSVSKEELAKEFPKQPDDWSSDDILKREG